LEVESKEDLNHDFIVIGCLINRPNQRNSTLTQRLTIKYDEQMREMFSTAARIIAQISDPTPTAIGGKTER
jgi:hypothetical protein